MKKISLIICTLALLSSTLFAKNFFDHRYFEIKAEVPVSISNNVFSAQDILQKEVVIDFTKIANSMPKDGLTVATNVKPNVEINLNLPVFNLGFELDVDVYGKFGIGKQLFDILGNGYSTGETKKIDMDVSADVFVSTGLKVGFKTTFFSYEINPAVFVPVIHVSPEVAYAEVTNSENGDISLVAIAKLNAYSVSDLTGFTSVAVTSLPVNSANALGFDLAGAVHCNYFDNLDIWGSARIPIVPGRLKYRASYEINGKYNNNVSNYITKATETSTEQDEASSEETEDFVWDMTDPSKVVFEELSENYYVNRPMKFNVFASYALIPNFIEFTGGAGFGIRNPFSENINEVKFYPEYYLESKFGLGNVLVLTGSTEYTDQIFKHQLAFKFNIRLVEVNVGTSLQSSDLASSFQLTGFGAFVNCYVGF